jgi:hypothetical protein
LNERFVSVGRHLRRSHPFPSFLEACDELTLEELTMGSPSPSPTALVASTGSGSSSPRPAPQQSAGHPNTGPGSGRGGGFGGKNNRRDARGRGGHGGHRGGKGGSSGTFAPPNQGASGSWPTHYNPWLIVPGPRPSLLGAPTQPPHQQALLAQQGAFLASQQHPPLQFQQQYL